MGAPFAALPCDTWQNMMKTNQDHTDRAELSPAHPAPALHQGVCPAALPAVQSP